MLGKMSPESNIFINKSKLAISSKSLVFTWFVGRVLSAQIAGSGK